MSYSLQEGINFKFDSDCTFFVDFINNLQGLLVVQTEICEWIVVKEDGLQFPKDHTTYMKHIFIDYRVH